MVYVKDLTAVGCQGGFSYSQVDYQSTFATHNDWVCESSGKVAQWLSMGLVGNVLGTLVFNPLSDV